MALQSVNHGDDCSGSNDFGVEKCKNLIPDTLNFTSIPIQKILKKNYKKAIIFFVSFCYFQNTIFLDESIKRLECGFFKRQMWVKMEKIQITVCSRYFIYSFIFSSSRFQLKWENFSLKNKNNIFFGVLTICFCNVIMAIKYQRVRARHSSATMFALHIHSLFQWGWQILRFCM